MNRILIEPNPRVLIVDDTPAIHEDFRKALSSSASAAGTDSQADDEAILFGAPAPKLDGGLPTFELTHAHQGQEAERLSADAIARGKPFAMAFVDMRMPPGWDGLQTIEALWRLDPTLQVAICTAYSDYTWDQIVARLGRTDRLLVLRKPFDRIEVCQIALALTEKWRLVRQDQHDLSRLDELVRLRTAELEQARLDDTRRLAELEQTVQERTADLRRQATRDRLTGLANRSCFSDRLDAAVSRAHPAASGGRPEADFAVLFLDFDHFKVVNDSLGHLVGDQLLCGIAQRIDGACSAFARTTGLDVLAARLGGDEFVILITGRVDRDAAVSLADALLPRLAEPYPIGDREVHTSASIGITTSELAYARAADVVRDADTAMYRAKLRKHCYVVFDPEMHQQAMARMTLGSDLRHAVERGELFLQYQPIVCLKTGSIRKFEALLRWRHPELGLVRPDRFIAIAEETGYIVTLGDWVLREACAQLARWQLRYGEASPKLTVNVSRSQLAGAVDFPVQLARAINDARCDPSQLGIEITENVIWSDPDSAQTVLAKIRQQGVNLLLDDFGVAYSSLGLLPRMPLTGVKIDREFIRRAEESRADAAIVHAIVMLANNLNLTVVAEGIENAGQVALLQALDCGLGQGFYFSAAVDADRAEQLIAEHQGRRSWPFDGQAQPNRAAA